MKNVDPLILVPAACVMHASLQGLRGDLEDAHEAHFVQFACWKLAQALGEQTAQNQLETYKDSLKLIAELRAFCDQAENKAQEKIKTLLADIKSSDKVTSDT